MELVETLAIPTRPGRSAYSLAQVVRRNRRPKKTTADDSARSWKYAVALTKMSFPAAQVVNVFPTQYPRVPHRVRETQHDFEMQSWHCHCLSVSAPVRIASCFLLSDA